MPEQHEIDLINERRLIREKTWVLLDLLLPEGRARKLGMPDALTAAIAAAPGKDKVKKAKPAKKAKKKTKAKTTKRSTS